MKTKFYTLVAIVASTLAGIGSAVAQSRATNDTIYMGAGYANEVYYSMAAGNKGAVAHDQWDIAFRANARSSSIITNDGVGVELYTYPKATITGWLTVDTAGFTTWKKMVNSINDWEEGAFCRNQKTHPDYGWGKYNDVTHNIIGDSLFVIKLRDGSFRKLWIVKKLSSLNTFEFRFATLDGTSDNTVTLDCSPYSTKNFVGYSITTKQVVDFEPVISAQWDLLFTRYQYTYPVPKTITDPPAGTLYLVAGTLSNYNVKVKRFDEAVNGFPAIDTHTMDSTRSPIGHDWKSFGNSWTLADPRVYFVQDKSGTLYKLIFKGFSGSSTGRIAFQKEVFSTTGINKTEVSGFNAAVYPNPVKEIMNLVVNPGKSKNVQVSVVDLSGRSVLNKRYDLQSDDLSTLQIPVRELKSGMYMVKIQSGSHVISRKVVVNN